MQSGIKQILLSLGIVAFLAVLASAIIIEDGVIFEQVNTNYTFYQPYSFDGDLYFLDNGLQLDSNIIEINPKTSYVKIIIYSLITDSFEFRVEPVANLATEFNLTGFTDASTIFVYRDGVLYENVTSDGLGFFSYLPASFSSPKQFLFTKDLLLFQVVDDTWTTQLFQRFDDLFNFFTQEDIVCQVQIDDSPFFDSLEVNHQVLATEYTHMDFLSSNKYYSRVRCRENGVWSFWSDTETFYHGNKPIFLDWVMW